MLYVHSQINLNYESQRHNAEQTIFKGFDNRQIQALMFRSSIARILSNDTILVQTFLVTHEKLVSMAVAWLRRYRCGVVLSEQACVSGEMPDAIGWKKACHSVLVECKVSRADFLADREKPFRQKPESGVGCERYYLAPRGLTRLQA